MQIQQLEKQFHIQIRQVNDVPESFSSTVYRCELMNGEEVFIKIPFSKVKFHRELDAYRVLEGKVAIPELIDVWEGDD